MPAVDLEIGAPWLDSKEIVGEVAVPSKYEKRELGEGEGSKEFDPVIVSHNPTRHGESEYDYLELLGEVNHLAVSGGSASTGWPDSSILERFRSPMKNTVLHLAALHGNDDVVYRVATQYPNLLDSRHRNENKDTPLHVAARTGHISTLRKLLDACVADSNVTRLLGLMKMRNNQGKTVLHEAMMMSSRSRSRATGIFLALEEWFMKNFESDIELPVPFYELTWNDVNKEGQSVLYLAVEAGLTEVVNRILHKCPEIATPKGKSPLAAAIMKRDKGMLTTILSKKQEWIHLWDEDTGLPLHCAASKGYHEGVVFLLDKCKTCTIQKDRYGKLPLHLAASEGHVKVVKELLRYCPYPNEMVDDQDHRNILHIAAESGKLDVVRYILQTPSLEMMINQMDVKGNTPLHVATASCQPKIVYPLTWDDRVDLNVANGDNKTAHDIAYEAKSNPSVFFTASLSIIALEPAGAKISPIKSRYSFTRDIEQLIIQNKEWQSRTVESLSVVSALIVTASVAACLSVPGEAQGTAHNLHKAMFHFFILCITISFFSSITATIILLWVKLSPLMEPGRSTFRLVMLLIEAALITLSLAFVAGVYTVISKLTWLAATFVVMAFILVVILSVLCTFLFLPWPSTRKILRYISYYPFIFWAWLFERPKP